MIFTNFKDLKTAIIKKKLMAIRRNALRALMIRATGKRRHSETKEQMAEFVMHNTSDVRIEQILGTNLNR